jgi:DNA polymerase zeta
MGVGLTRGSVTTRGLGGGAVQRTLNACQFALKLIANVTYGYTAANFSGRMPMSELADAIVQLGRDTLERAIKHIEANAKCGGRWSGAQVVYGDTDSLFVRLPGRSKADAFRCVLLLQN